MMQSFDDLELPSEITEALSAEGFEEPTEFQRKAIPLLRRGNNLLGAVGPGAGTLLTYGTAILERTEPQAGRPGALVLVPTAAAATGLAESLAHIAAATGHSVGAFGGAWLLPEQCDVLFSTPSDVKSAVDRSRLTLEGVQFLVVDGASTIETISGVQTLGTLFEYVPAGAQRVVLSQPVTESIRALLATHVTKAIRIPPAPAIEGAAAKPPDLGEIRFRITGVDKVDVLAPLVSELLDDGARHVLLFCRSADRAADVGDFLTLHGFMAGAPGDETAPVWLAGDALPAREALNESTSPAAVATVSLDCPADADSMDRRHGAGGQATVLLLPREVPHFRDTARRTGYRVRPLPPPESVVEDRIREIRDRLEEAASRGDLAPLYLVLEPLLERFSPQELAAAALALLIPQPASPAAPSSTTARAEKATGTDGWTRLFVSIGEMEGVKPRDLLGALAGESGVDGSSFGKIEIRDTYSLVEVRPSEAEKVIKAVNGSTIRGRSARVDYDRGSSRGSGTKSGENRPRGSRAGSNQRDR
jgi:ATP-dependent RNA helicase DeaD